MHPEDEKEFEAKILADETVLLVDGPRWKTEFPEGVRTLSKITGTYCIVWSTSDIDQLKARYIEQCDDWYCESEHATIQFLRSELGDSVITEGRIAISTVYDHSDFSEPQAKQVDARFKMLRRYIKKEYCNSIVQWCNPTLPIAPASLKRSANPSKPDPQIWVGPYALEWMRKNDCRRIKQHKSAVVEGALTNAC
ncbi:hypothetical protein [Teredinibacter franksiae]|uniref:hypothetical protein n=1 Tax=Teredinibacter franksiae TaxID=2761453 RepID=UPI00162A2C7B|nr:hypothetical protein [Teredinibacter franksiae]